MRGLLRTKTWLLTSLGALENSVVKAMEQHKRSEEGGESWGKGNNEIPDNLSQLFAIFSGLCSEAALLSRFQR